MSRPDLSGEWLSRYSYHDGDSSEHNIAFEVDESNLFIGRGTDDAGSQLTLRLKHDTENNVLTGFWHEKTSPAGAYKGAEFHGAVQFILAAGLDAAHGTWVGYNSRRDKVNSGDWSLTKQS
jgi:hypothetical protein